MQKFLKKQVSVFTFIVCFFLFAAAQVICAQNDNVFDEITVLGQAVFGTQEGNIGIGIANPTAKLHINGAIQTAVRQIVSNGITKAVSQIDASISLIDSVIFVDTSKDADDSFFLELPPASEATIGRIFEVFKSDNSGKMLIIKPNEGNTLNGEQGNIATGNSYIRIHIIGNDVNGWIVSM